MNEATSPPFTPFVSVVVPAYNEREHIAACIESLLAQDYPAERREIVIVDNNSTDGTDEVIKKYPVTLCYERELQTPAATRNTGIRQAQGEIIAMMDGDCRPHPDWLRHLVQPFADPRVIGVAGAIRPVSKDTVLSRFQTQVNPAHQHHMNGLWYVATGNCAYRRKALLKAGLFQARLYTGEDIDLGLRLQLPPHNGLIASADQAIVEHPSEDSLRDLCNRYRRYGYSELLLDTMYRHEPRYSKRPRQQVAMMLRQAGSLLRYPFSIVGRGGKTAVRALLNKGRWDADYLAWPVIWLAIDASNLQGKLRGVWATRFFKHLPQRLEQVV